MARYVSSCIIFIRLKGKRACAFWRDHQASGKEWLFSYVKEFKWNGEGGEWDLPRSHQRTAQQYFPPLSERAPFQETSYFFTLFKTPRVTFKWFPICIHFSCSSHIHCHIHTCVCGWGTDIGSSVSTTNQTYLCKNLPRQSLCLPIADGGLGPHTKHVVVGWLKDMLVISWNPLHLAEPLYPKTGQIS